MAGDNAGATIAFGSISSIVSARLFQPVVFTEDTMEGFFDAGVAEMVIFGSFTICRICSRVDSTVSPVRMRALILASAKEGITLLAVPLLNIVGVKIVFTRVFVIGSYERFLSSFFLNIFMCL